MGYFDALLLAVLQGLTGFLPVSSSGHLVLAQYFFSSSGEIDLLYNVVLHVATGVALLIYFRHDLIALWTGLMRPSQASKSVFSGYEKQTLGYIVLALMPTAVVGLFIDTVLISLLTRPDVVGCMLVITGALLWWGRGRQRQHRTAPMRSTDALVIGLLQGLAVTPGISRSGATITGGILLGLDREFATRFSLLISVPATFGATILEVSKLEAHALPPFGPYVGYDHCRLGGIRSHRPYPASCPTRSVLSLRMVSVAARQPTERRVLHIFGGFGSSSRSLRSKSGGQTATPQSV